MVKSAQFRCIDMKKLALAIFLGLGCQYAGAAVSVNTATGTLTNGTTGWITGSGFGPLRIYPFQDSFDEGAYHSTYSATQAATFNSDSPRYTGDGQNLYMNFSNATPRNAYVTWNNTHYKNWHIVYWIKISTNWDWGTTGYNGGNQFLANIKQFRMWNSGSTNENLYRSFNGAEGGGQLEAQVENVSGEGKSYGFLGFINNFEKGRYHQFKYKYCSSDYNTSNGTFTETIDGVVKINKTMKSHDTDNVLDRPFILGWQNEWSAGEGPSPDSSDDAPNEWWMSDLHVQVNGLNLVELSTCSTYNTGCTPEPQPITDWQSGTIRFIVRPRSLTGTVYAFVTDETGSVNSTGIQMTGTSNTTALAPYSFGVTSSSAALQWTSVGAASYQAVFDDNSDFTSPVSSGILAGNATMYSGLNPGTTYSFQVKISTEDDASYGTHSTETYRTNVAPSNNGGGTTSSALQFDWNTSIGVHVVLDDDSAFGSPSSSGTLTGNTTTYQNLSASTQYFFQVKPSTDGNGSYSSANGTTDAPPAASDPVAPAPMKVGGTVAISGNVRTRQ